MILEIMFWGISPPFHDKTADELYIYTHTYTYTYIYTHTHILQGFHHLSFSLAITHPRKEDVGLVTRNAQA